MLLIFIKYPYKPQIIKSTIIGAKRAGQTFGSQLESFGDVLSQARLIQQGLETSANQARDDARSIIKDALGSFGSGAFGMIDSKELGALEKLAGYPKGFLQQLGQTLKEQELERKKAEPPKTLDTDKGIFQWDSTTGKWKSTGFKRRETPKPPQNITGANYNTRIEEEISNVYEGRYGIEGAREKAINILKKEFPRLDVEGDIYNRIPDNYETQIKKPKSSTRQTASTLDPQTMDDLIDDIEQNASLQELYSAYPEVSPSLIQSIYYNQ